MPYISDRTRDTSTSVGTGAFVLANVAPTGYQTFLSAFGATSRVVGYCIASQTLNEWEVGKGTFNGSSGLTRDVVRSSSNANALVNFSAGTKDVFITASAELLDNANIGMQYAQMRGMALP